MVASAGSCFTDQPNSAASPQASHWALPGPRSIGLKRPEHRLAHGLAPEAIEEFLAELAALIEPVEVHFQWRPQSRDPNDEMVLEAAINGRADALVTCNVADFAGPAERFRISVLRPGDLLKKVKP
jgi:predicted nucleic acid-binding protein